ncbi:MAG: ABC transporter substrate-binding protein [Marinilabiliales bacterium]
MNCLIKYIIVVAGILLLSNCSEKSINDSKVQNKTSALHFSIYNDFGDYIQLRVLKPWQNAGNIHFDYLFSSNKNQNFSYINIPAKRIICMSTTHVAFLSKLNEEKSIVGVSGKKFIYNPNIRNNSSIVDVGYNENLNYELIISLKPDLVLLYGIGDEITGVMKKLNNLGIPAIIIAEYLEKSPLARLEWIKVFGLITGKEKMADSIFNAEYDKYQEIKNLTKNIDYRPEVFTGLPYKDHWYVTPGDNITNNFILDAGAFPVWYNSGNDDIITTDFETVILKAGNAEYWINTGIANSKKDILNIDERMQNFSAFKNDNIYNNNKRINANGGNDYFESAVVQPVIVLKDLIKIFHPDILPEHNLYYYKKL